MLGSSSRKYADATGNPIGSLSETIYMQNKQQKKTKTHNDKQKLFPWCTCTGSKVCTYYTNKFGKKDGTHIKFIGKMQNKTKKLNKTINENKAINNLKLHRHLTPGITLHNK